jgi:beta-galactosidase
VPAYAEVEKIGSEFAHVGDALAGTTPHSRVALLQSYESRWAIDFQRHNKDLDPVEEFDAFYKPLELGAQSVDVIATDAPLDSYALVVAPALNVLSSAQAEHLADYVRRGGHLVLGPRSGMKDPYNALWPQRQPGPLVTLLGGRVEQFYALDQPVSVTGEVGTGQATIWAEALEPLAPDTHVGMTYGTSPGWLDGKPALLTRKVGKGTVTYLGAWLEPALMSKLAAKLLADAGVKPLITGVPADIEVCERSGGGKRIWIIINHGHSAETVHLPTQWRSLLAGNGGVRNSDGGTRSGSDDGGGTHAGNDIQLAAHDVAVVDVRAAESTSR